MSDTPFKTPLPSRSHHGKPQPGPPSDSDNDLLFSTPKAAPPSASRPHSDSEESITSTNSDNNVPGTPSSNGEISIVAEFDDLMRLVHHLKTDRVTTETAFSNFVEQTKEVFAQLFAAEQECRRLNGALDEKTQCCADLENKLLKARNLLDTEKMHTRNARRERDELMLQINHIRDVLFKGQDQNRIPEETRHKLSFLTNNNKHYSSSEWDLPTGNGGNGGHPPVGAQLSAIKEINSTGSILSDFSYSRSEDDPNESYMHAGKSWRKHRPSTDALTAEPAVKKRRSSGHKVVEISATDTVRATTTLTVNKDGPITATSVIESVPKPTAPPEANFLHSVPSAPPADLVFESWARGPTTTGGAATLLTTDSPLLRGKQQHCHGNSNTNNNNLNSRPHSFQQKTLVMPDTCGVCDTRIRFGKTAVKCKDCKAICHPECKDSLPVPCIPTMNTPNQRNMLGVIGDYTPTTPPMVPALLIHCINEIELRGLGEIGLYRIPGAERDVKTLKERFLRGKGAPCLNQTDIHVICGCVKDFLRSLHEPIITYGLWKDFVAAAEMNDQQEIVRALYRAINELPQPNRDTLAYVVLHLQKIAQSPECKMSTSSLAKIFGPTLVGYSSDDPNPNNLLNEVVQNNKVMEYLLNIPSNYWSSFIDIDTTNLKVPPPSRLQQTPSTDSLLRQPATRGLFTPNRNLLKRKQKYFASPR